MLASHILNIKDTKKKKNSNFMPTVYKSDTNASNATHLREFFTPQKTTGGSSSVYRNSAD